MKIYLVYDEHPEKGLPIKVFITLKKAREFVRQQKAIDAYIYQYLTVESMEVE